MKVSVIIPVYNAEKYLSEAIESILNQTYTDFELLLIDDMSTDNSKEICKTYCEKDNRIILFENNSESHGPGPTRNIGLDYATGEYIYFMDADDWADKNLLQCAVNRMQETNADIVQFGVIYERNDRNNSEQYYWRGKNILIKDEIKHDFSNFWKENHYGVLDFITHEFGHGVTLSSVNLHYSGESASVNESLSDIWAACVENYLGGRTQEQIWQMGEDRGKISRSMSNPKTYNHPDTYHGNY